MTSAGEAVDRFLGRLDELGGRAGDEAIFITVDGSDRLRQRAAEIDRRPAAEVPLRGLVVAVKDNIDVAGLPTTAGCPSYAYRPGVDAPVVARLRAAGAVAVAKTNLDQFATGLVGTRSPFGVPPNPVDPGLVPGGSSSGSAVAVARGLVDVALGTDTAGSGRVPAACCGIVGLKPTRGRLPTTGVVPAVRSVDCVSVFADDAETAATVATLAAGPDPGDPLSRSPGAPPPTGRPVHLGIIAPEDLAAAGARAGVVQAYRLALERLTSAGDVVAVTVDLRPVFAVGDLLYGGPLVAQRTEAVGDFIASRPPDLDPTVAAIITAGATHAAIDAYRSANELATLRREAAAALADVDVLALPTVPRAVTRAEVAVDPVGPNTELGRFTTFTNLLDLCALTVPVDDPSLPPGPESSLSLHGPAWAEDRLVAMADRLRRHATAGPLPLDGIRLVVAGAHLRGQPLAGQLVELGARWEGTTHTAPTYRLYALPGGPPHKPALVHDPGGAAIEVDVWRLSAAGLGRFLTMVPAPLALGSVTLADGSVEVGFVAEPRAVEGASEITALGGWRRHVGDPTPTNGVARL